MKLNSRCYRPVLVANNEIPIQRYSGILIHHCRDDGNSALFGPERSLLSFSGVSVLSKTTTAVLLDSGNLVLRVGNSITWGKLYDKALTIHQRC